jgi:hypothetical protein
MKVIKIKCPHCTKTFDLAPLLSGEVRASLIQELGLTSPACTVQDGAVVDLAEAHRLRELEYEKHLSELRATILELHRKAAASSQQRAGETFEAEIYEQLRTRFTEDKVTRVGKGRNGGDIVHEIRDEQQRPVSKILWEVKNTSGWNPKWIEKVQADALRCGAQICVIISRSLPKGLTNFGEIDGIWITNAVCHLGLALALRGQLLACAQIRTELADAARLCALSTYITSSEFKAHVAAIALAVTRLHEQVEREKQLFDRHWAERLNLAASIRQSIATVSGGLDGVIGRVGQCIQDRSLPEPKAQEPEVTEI